MISRVREFINGPSQHAYSVAEQVHYAGVSGRIMRNVVNAIFGASPKQLIILRQLLDLRLGLENPRIGDSVAKIAAQHGVWELRRFLGRYRRVYGELPIETLAAVR